MVKLQTEPVGQSGQIVENPDDVADLQQGNIVEAQIAEGLPV